MIINETFNFEVAEKDESNEMTWDEAMEKFKDNPEGWRLPTRTELMLIYEHRKEIGSFEKAWYWSSITDDSIGAYIQDIDGGLQGWDFRRFINRVRCIREIRR
jgi:hypothetical protein